MNQRLNLEHVAVSIAFGLLAGWAAKALHLQTKTAAKSDAILSAPAGTAQGILDSLGSVGISELQNLANKVVK